MAKADYFYKDDSTSEQQHNKRKERRRIFIILVCSAVLVSGILSVIGLLYSRTPADAASPASRQATPAPPFNGNGDPLVAGATAIEFACNRTLYPTTCNNSLYTSLGALSASPLQLTIISVHIALDATVSSLHMTGQQTAGNLTVIAGDVTAILAQELVSRCIKLLQMSSQQLNASIAELSGMNLLSLKRSLKGAQERLNAASIEQLACAAGLAGEAGASDMLERQRVVSELIVNAVCLVQALASLGYELTSWRNIRRGLVCTAQHL